MRGLGPCARRACRGGASGSRATAGRSRARSGRARAAAAGTPAAWTWRSGTCRWRWARCTRVLGRGARAGGTHPALEVAGSRTSQRTGPGSTVTWCRAWTSCPTDKVAGRVASADRPPIAANLHGPGHRSLPLVQRSRDLDRAPSQWTDQRATRRRTGVTHDSSRGGRAARRSTERPRRARLSTMFQVASTHGRPGSDAPCVSARRHRTAHRVAGVHGPLTRESPRRLGAKSPVDTLHARAVTCRPSTSMVDEANRGRESC